MRWLGVHVRGVIAVCAIVVAASFSTGTGALYIHERAEREALQAALAEASDDRETAAEAREANAQRLEAETRRLIEEMRDPIEHAPESQRAATYEAVLEAVTRLREVEALLSELCDAEPDCTPEDTDDS